MHTSKRLYFLELLTLDHNNKKGGQVILYYILQYPRRLVVFMELQILKVIFPTIQNPFRKNKLQLT